MIKLIEIISTSVGFNGACGGQFMDLQGIESLSAKSRKDLPKKTSSFFRIGSLGAYLVTESKPVSIDDLKKMENMSDLLRIAFQTYDDFDDLIEDENEGQSNCVLHDGINKSYAKFINNLRDVEQGLKEMKLYTEVIHDIELIMKCHIDKSHMK